MGESCGSAATKRRLAIGRCGGGQPCLYLGTRDCSFEFAGSFCNGRSLFSGPRLFAIVQSRALVQKTVSDLYRHCFSSLIHSEPGNAPGRMKAFMTFANMREQLLSKLFAGNAGPKAADPTEKTAPLFGAVKYTMSARTWCSYEPERP